VIFFVREKTRLLMLLVPRSAATVALVILASASSAVSFSLTVPSLAALSTCTTQQIHSAPLRTRLSASTSRGLVMSSSEVRIGKATADVSKSLGEYIEKQSAAAIASRGRFSIGFSGGSLPKLACGDIVKSSSIAWDKWDVFFVDERCVALDHADSNYKSLNDNLLSKLATPIPAAQVFAYDPSSSSAEDAASKYAEKVRAHVPPSAPGGLPCFDLLLLGMGEDGHTASLFPGHALLGESDKIVAHILDSPKPPPERITLTYPLIKAAKEVAVVAAGAGKASLLKEILGAGGHAGEKYPVERASNVDGKLKWFLDEAAVAELDVAALKTF